MEKLLNIDGGLLEKANAIIGSTGLNLDSVIKVCLNRIVNENSIEFLFTNNQKVEKKAENRDLQEDSGYKMIKSLARRLFENKGYTLSYCCTFASENQATRNYWMNPNFDVLKEDWDIILNNKTERELYLFKVPKNALNELDLVCRSDNPNLIDIQIAYNDVTFTDNRSRVSFKKFYVSSLKY